MQEHEPLQPLSISQREALEEAVSSYEAALTADVAGLLLARGIDRATGRTFRLGVVGTDPFPGHDRFQGWLAIPYLDADRKPLSLRFRCPQAHDHREFGHGKYMSMTDEPSRVFNVRAIHEADDEIHVAEGEFDAMVLNRVGLPAIAIPGANAWKGHHRRMLAGFNRVHVWGDPDDAGAEFVQRVTRALRQARGVRLRNGDVSDTFMASGTPDPDALLSLITPKEVKQ